MIEAGIVKFRSPRVPNSWRKADDEVWALSKKPGVVAKAVG